LLNLLEEKVIPPRADGTAQSRAMLPEN